MKKIKLATLFAAVALTATMFTSCEEKEPTALNQSNAAQSIVKGYVTYTYATASKTGNLDIVPSNTKVIVETINKDANDKDIIAKQVVSTNAKGYYEAKVAIPTGKDAKVMLHVNFVADNYSAPKDGGSAEMVQTEFYGVATANNVHNGETYVLNLQAAAKGVVEEAFFGDADNH